MNKKRVLFSLTDQEYCVEFAKELVDLGWEVVATKETADLLTKENVPVTDFSKYLNVDGNWPFPPTLHPDMELALTTDQGKTIDMVYITTYPMSSGNDVGGHTILGLAAKGDRIVVFDNDQMSKMIDHLKENSNECKDYFRKELIEKANQKIASHYASLADSPLSNVIKKEIPLANGENPYQVPATQIHTDNADNIALGNFEKLSGDTPCFTNIADFDSVLQAICAIYQAFKVNIGKSPYIAIAAKHGNPCGLAIDWEKPEKAVENALWGNPRAIWGGEFITNFAITENFAELLFSSDKRKKKLEKANWNLDLLAAPDFEVGALEILRKRERLKIFKNSALSNPNISKQEWAYRMVRGGYLKHPPNNYILNLKECEFSSQKPDSSVIDSIIIGWATTFFSAHGGNEVAVVKDRMLLGSGGGPATVDACVTAVARAKEFKHNLENAVFAADAFFPFTDATEVLVEAGCKYGIVPAGGQNFELIKKYFESNKVAVYYLPEDIRGFCKH